MKTKILKSILVLLTCTCMLPAFGQSPQSMNYQAVARNSNGDILANQVISFRISILKGSSAGTAVYVETQKDTTNQFGLANLKIGAGTVVSGVFSTINWGNDSYFVKIEMDQNGGTSFQLMGVSQLLSVPYSLYSENSGAAEGPWKLNGSNLFYNNGLVGIGTNTPSAGLQINNFEYFNTWRVMLRLQSTGGASEAITFFDNNSGWLIGHTAYDNSFYWKYYSNLTTPTSEYRMRLSKTGLLEVCELKVTSTWCDYVFDDKYKLMNLNDLEKFIKTQKHLPGIPTASEIENDGLYVGDMSKRMMEKIEELTLYVIDLNKSVEQLKKENTELKKQLKHAKN